MKKSVFLILAFAALSGATLLSCSEKENIVVTNPPSVTIGLADDNDPGSATLLFTLSENATGFRWALGSAEDKDAFLDGTIDGIQDVEAVGTKEIPLENLEASADYTVFAAARDAEGTEGPAAMFTFAIKDNAVLHSINMLTDYVTSSSAAIRINPENYWYRFEYALAAPEQKEAFENGSLKGITSREALDEFTVCYFNIEPGTGFIFYIRAYNRYEECSETFEYAINTPEASAVPEISLDIDDQNIYEGNYTFTPNSHCGKFGVFVCNAGDYDGVFYNEYGYDGDVLGRLLEYMEGPSYSNPMVIGENGGTAKVQYFTPEFALDAPLEAWALLYDSDGEPFGVQRIQFSTPSFDESYGRAEVTSFEFTDISPWYCPFTVSFNEETLLAFWTVFTESEWEAELRNAENSSDPNYLAKKIHELSYDSIMESHYFFYGDEEIFEGSVGFDTGRYYVAFIPVNGNGPVDGGWGEPYAEFLEIQ